MKNTTDYAAAAQKNEPHAHAVIRKSGIIPAWKNIGAEINLVGSLKIGTLGKHPDIDFHTYTPELDIRQSFAVMAQIAQNPQARRIEFVNLPIPKSAVLSGIYGLMTITEHCGKLILSRLNGVQNTTAILKNRQRKLRPQ